MENCIFCKIINKTVPSEIIYENDSLIAISDIRPKAPTHILIISKKHIPNIDVLDENDRELISQIIYTAKDLARKNGINEKGYRLVFNVKEEGGQEVEHIHLHLLGGKKLSAMA